ncbi:GtrA family protein [Demetria terragena]|uniref:GtrA family protein n=1 Tax=Demetria terragena TaxID=63959 RepID=UPI00039F61E9|nr:GtrA family protein [Demetria terragena]
MPRSHDPDRRAVLRGQLVRFAIVGVGSTVLATALFWLFAHLLDHHQVASALSLVLSTIANTAVNRRFSFGVTGREGHWQVQLKALVLLAMTLGVTALALAVLEWMAPQADTVAAVVAFTVGNLIATVVRFVLLRRWLSTSPAASQTSVPPTENGRGHEVHGGGGGI